MESVVGGRVEELVRTTTRVHETSRETSSEVNGLASTPGYSCITSHTTVTQEGNLADDGRRNQDTLRRYQALQVRLSGEGWGHCRRRRELIRRVKTATVRQVWWVMKGTRGIVRVCLVLETCQIEPSRVLCSSMLGSRHPWARRI